MTTQKKDTKTTDAKSKAIEKQEMMLASDDNILKLTPDVIKNYICKDANPQEIALFLNQCTMYDLTPFKQEIFLVKYGRNYPATTIVAHKAYLKRADRSGKWRGIESGTTGSVKEGNLVAWAKVYREGWTVPVYVEVDYDECVQTTKDGKPNSFWMKMPKRQLKKVAESAAIRTAFPDETASLPYTVYEVEVDEQSMAKIIKAESGTSKPPEKIVDAEVVEEKAEAKPKPKPEEENRPLEIRPEDNSVTQEESDARAEAKKKKKKTTKSKSPDLTDPKVTPFTETGGEGVIQGEVITGTPPRQPENEPEQKTLTELPPEPEEEDGELTAKRNAVGQKLEKIIAPAERGGYGRDGEDLLKKIHGNLKEKYSSVRANIPEDLSEEECNHLLKVLQLTIEAEEEKIKAKRDKREAL